MFKTKFLIINVPFSVGDMTDEQKELLGWTERMSETHTFHVSKSICLLSHYSFGETFERWLIFLQVGLFVIQITV